MDALELLKRDHQAVAQLLERGLKAEKAEERQQILAKIKGLLKPHEMIEEKLFYPELKKQAIEDKNEEEKNKINEAYQEHHVVDLLIAELEKTAPEGEVWKAKFTVLKENIEHHVQEEEQVLFVDAREAFNKEELKEFGEKMAAMKEEASA